MAQGRFIDIDGWKRRQHFELFRSLAHPFWSVTVEMDVTRVWDAAARDQRSFFLATSFAVLGAANETEAFRLRLRPAGVWCHDRVGLGTTVLRPDETFGFADLWPCASFDEFEVEGRAVMARAHREPTLESSGAKADDLVYHSSLPWLRFTSFTNALGRGDDSIPRIVFGRAVQDGVTRRMPVAVEVHHALVDGIDVARFFERFEEALSRPIW